jgi:hypothetical protein
MRILALLLVMLTGCGGCVSVPSQDSLESLALHILTASDKGAAVCSGTKTGPAELTTAKHCVDGMTLKLVNDREVTVASTRYVGEDVAVITLTKPMFTHWAKRGPTPKPGDRIRYWGTPLGLPNVYREGVVVAVTGVILRASLYANALLLIACLLLGGLWRYEVGRKNAILFAEGKAQLAASEAARKHEQQDAANSAKIAQAYEQGKLDAQAAGKRVADDLRAGNLKLRKRWQGCPKVPGVAADPAEPDAEAGPGRQGFGIRASGRWPYRCGLRRPQAGAEDAAGRGD